MRTLLMVLLLVGCAARERSQNRKHLNDLAPGLTHQQVVAVMHGTPYRSESYRAGNHRIDVLFYYTDRKARDGAITDDELTPVVLVDGKVDGWGWSYWQDAVQRYEIRVR